MNHPILTDLNGNVEPLYDVRQIKRVTELNGERSLVFNVLNTEDNQHAWGLLTPESKAEYDNVTYTIKRTKEKNLGKRSETEVSLKHKMFTDLIDHFVYTEISGFKSLTVALNHILNGTGYTFSIVGSFSTADVGSQFGGDNALSLLQKILKLYRVEFDVVDTHLTFESEIGNKTDIQYRYKHNINGIIKDFSTENLSTKIRGIGKDGLVVDYISPNASLYPADTPDGFRHQDPVEDERYTTEEGLLERLQNDLNDQPELSIEVDFVDLRNVGYPYEVPNIGDEVFVIYEPMNLDITARIIKIEEEIDAKGRVIKTVVILSNFANNLDDMIADLGQTQKEINDRFTDGGTLKYTFYDDAIKRVTEDVQSAQTELEFINGIIAREKTNPNEIVLLNSKGILISEDNGVTSGVAINAKGVVAESIIGQSIIGLNLSSVDESGYFHVNGSNSEFVDNTTGRKVTISPDGMNGYNQDGTERFRIDKLLVTSSALGTSNSNVYLAPDSINEVRVVDVSSIPSDGVPENYSYRPIRALGYRFAPLANGYIGTDKEVRITSLGFTQADGSVIYRDLRASVLRGIAFETTTEHAYMSPSATGSLKVTAKGTTDSYRPIIASEYNTPSSSFFKKNIEDYTGDALELINGTPVRKYHMLEDDELIDPKRIGLIVQESPLEIINLDGGESINTYSKTSLLWKGQQEEDAKVEALKQTVLDQGVKIQTLEQKATDQDLVIQSLISRIEALENQ